MQEIYLDNGATSFPKAPGVSEAVADFLDQKATSINRSGYQESFLAEELLYETRELLGDLFNFPKPEQIAFSLNATTALNFLLKGLLKPNDHCLVSSLEHNAVMRPLNQLKEQGVNYERVWTDETGILKAEDVLAKIKKETKAVIFTHASNVSGTILPLEELGAICQSKGIYFIIDAAQTAGSIPVDLQKLQADALAFTGHKGLLGPQGVGGFLFKKELGQKLIPLITGGTGSFSEFEQQPNYFPDKFEAGTLNMPGIIGLNAALKFLKKEGLATIRETELALTKELLEGFTDIKNVVIKGPLSLEQRTATISIDCVGFDNANVAYTLHKNYGIRTRVGLHCAPSAHESLKTFPSGTIRFSPGYFNTKKEMAYTISKLAKVLTSEV